jgi:hypothetical protein
MAGKPAPEADPALEAGTPPSRATAGAPPPGKPPAAGTKQAKYVGFGTVLTLVVCYALLPAGINLTSRLGDGPDPVPHGHVTPVPTLTGAPFVSPSPESPPAALRDDARPVSVVGPFWEAGEKTYTMNFRGVPFAFRTGKTWGCLGGTWEHDDGKPIEGLGWRCIDERAGPKRPQIDLLIRRCERHCSAGEQARLDTDWLDDPVSYVRRDATTRYAERTRNGKYTLVVSHFFADKPGGRLGWQVALQAECRPIDQATVQKIVNDIRTQSG